jgi:predicted RecB family nuclease
MRFRASNSYDFYRPSKCARRVALRYRGVPEAERSEFIELLFRLGERHEKAHLGTLPEVADLFAGDDEARERDTLAAIRAGAPAIYQARFRASIDLDGETCEVVGEPDFLIRDGNGYRIRDSKLARLVDDDHHPEITLQLQLYGWLYERVVGAPPAGLEVHAGSGEIVPVPYDSEAALGFVRNLRRMRLAPEDAYEPVGWSKCGGCGYFDLCWKQAEAANDIALLPAVSQARAIDLRAYGIATIRDVPAAIQNPALRDLFYQGKRNPRLRDSAVRLLRSAEAHISGENIVIAQPSISNSPNFAVLDLEGMPPYFDELEKIYLWGVKVFGEKPSDHLFAQAGFGADGDREGWDSFLRLASHLFAEYGDISFVHWGSYERAKLLLYLDRYRDRDGTASRILEQLVNLLDVVRESVIFPLPSLSLKVVEKHVRFTRRLSETGGAWAICRYIEATETSDPAGRAEIMERILAYNEEDLNATWAVMKWLREASIRSSNGSASSTSCQQ